MTAVLTTMAELEEFLNDPAKLTAEAEADTLINTLKNSAALIEAKDAIKNGGDSVSAQAEIQKQRVIAEYLAEQKDAGLAPLDLSVNDVKARMLGSNRITIENRGQRLAVQDPRCYGGGPRAAANGIFGTAGEFFQAVGFQGHKDRSKFTPAMQEKFDQITKRFENSYGSTVPADGGVLIPDDVYQGLLMVSLEDSVVRPRATVVPMSTARLGFPAVDSTSNATSIYGGVTTAWIEEGASITESQGSFELIKLDAKKLAAFAAVPNELLDDAPAFQLFLDRAFPTALSWGEDIAFTSGTGVGEPLGYLNAPAAVTVAKESGQAASTVLWENIVKMYARMLPSSLGRAVWVVSPDTFPELATMALSVGTGGSAIWLNNGAAGPPMTILGRPVIVSEKVSSLTTAGDINFVDFSYYLIGDRMSAVASASPHVYFQNDKMAYRIIERLDGRPWIQSAITPKNGGNTLSPFVQLGAR